MSQPTQELRPAEIAVLAALAVRWGLTPAEALARILRRDLPTRGGGGGGTWDASGHVRAIVGSGR